MQALRPQVEALCPAISRLAELQQGVRPRNGQPLHLLQVQRPEGGRKRTAAKRRSSGSRVGLPPAKSAQDQHGVPRQMHEEPAAMSLASQPLYNALIRRSVDLQRLCKQAAQQVVGAGAARGAAGECRRRWNC